MTRENYVRAMINEVKRVCKKRMVLGVKKKIIIIKGGSLPSS